MSTSKVDQLPPVASGRKRGNTDYMYRPPAIKPNYGKVKETLLPKTKMSRVLLFENNMQENVLNVKLKYISKERQTYKYAFKKTRYSFIDMQNNRRKWHELWENGYKKLTDAFIGKYGRLYTPEPTPEVPEEIPFSIHARLAPPINVLCFYLDAQQQAQNDAQRDRNERQTFGRRDMSVEEYLRDHERLIQRERSEIISYPRSIDDPRFKNLSKSLASPGFESMGYLQLSPTFCQSNAPKKPVTQWRHRQITLPDFYTKRRGSPRHSETSRESSRQQSPRTPSRPLSPRISSRRPSVTEESSVPIVQDKPSSIQEMANATDTEEKQVNDMST
ncbi:hypothetical protein ACF0H5_015432 [Mactra antiquata]